ncbi:hypothetical protein V6N11_016551 [Hibiscus sabdariffa]|uniref:Uncharacterized protein n=1 Tax=Hibiscus sabdariffa TaxID=183260 RepID=A0ABR2TVV8_9ROSI
MQCEAESGLERLHQCAEKELQVYLNAEGPSKDFNEFRTKLAGLTSVTRNYFENLVRALSDVDWTPVELAAGWAWEVVAVGEEVGRAKVQPLHPVAPAEILTTLAIGPANIALCLTPL